MVGESIDRNLDSNSWACQSQQFKLCIVACCPKCAEEEEDDRRFLGQLPRDGGFAP